MAKSKLARDPNASNTNLAAFQLFSNAMRENSKRQRPNLTSQQLGDHLADLYSGLSPLEKEVWQKRAEADKNRYLKELTQYVPPNGYDAKGDSMAPKSFVSGYFLYQSAIRQHVMEENPGLSGAQVNEIISNMYQNLSPIERSHWNCRDQDTMATPEVNTCDDVPPAGYDRRQERITKDNDPQINNNKEQKHHKHPDFLQQKHSKKRKRSKISDDRHGIKKDDLPHMSNKKKPKKPRKPKDPDAPKRARQPYILWYADFRAILKAENPALSFGDLTKVAGKRWKESAPEVKEKYMKLAEQDKIRFEREKQAYDLRKKLRRDVSGEALEAKTIEMPRVSVPECENP